jgi:hypothetical protein
MRVSTFIKKKPTWLDIKINKKLGSILKVDLIIMLAYVHNYGKTQTGLLSLLK